MAYLLVVDDDADSRDVLCRFLTRAGHKCVAAPNGREALESVLARVPELIVLDLLMPDVDGITLLEILRSYLRLQSVPVVVLTAAPDSPQARRASKVMGVRAVLPKAKTSLADIHRVIGDELRRAG